MEQEKILVVGQIWEEVRYKRLKENGLTAADKHYPGGNGLITARRIAEQGWPVRLAAGLGDDETAEEILSELEKSGVETEDLKRQKNRNTPQMAIYPETDEEGIVYKRILTGEKPPVVPEGPDLMRIRLEQYKAVILEDLETWQKARYPELCAFLKRAHEKGCRTMAALGEGFTDETALQLSKLLGGYCDIYLLHVGKDRTDLLEMVRRVRQEPGIRSRTYEKKERLADAFSCAAERLLEGGASAVVFDTGEEGRYGSYCQSRDGRRVQFFEEQHRMKTVDYSTQGTFTAYFMMAYMTLSHLKEASRRAAKAARVAADSGKIYAPMKERVSEEEMTAVLYKPLTRTRDEWEVYEEDAGREPYPVNLVRAIGVSEEVPELFLADQMTQDQWEGLLVCLGELDEDESRYLDYRYRLHWSRENCRHILGLDGDEQDALLKNALEHLRRRECLYRILLGRSGNRLRLLKEREHKSEASPARAADTGLTRLKFPDGLVWKLKAKGIDSAYALADILREDPNKVLEIERIGKKKINLMLQRLLEAGFMTEEDTIRSLDRLSTES